MAVYAYSASNDHGLAFTGTIVADTPRQARDLLRGQGLAVRQMMEHQQSTTARRDRTVAWKWRKRSSAKLTAMVRELSTMLAVGIPLIEALDTLCQQHHGRFRTSLMLVRDRVASGTSLAGAMSMLPEVFDSLTLIMVEVGENSGTLETVLEQLADFKERSLELKDRVLTALLYPFIVLTAALCVCVFLMTVVVPMLLTNLLEAGRRLPWPTRVLKTASDVLVHHGWWLAILGLILLFGGAVVMKTSRGRRLWHRLLLRIPIVGPMAVKQGIARIALVMSTLLRSGIVYLSAVDIAARSTRNVVLCEALQQSGRDVGAGRDIAEALARADVFPPLVVHIFSVGQKSGRLEEMLERLATNYDRQVASAATRLTSLLEPILIVSLAVLVGFILFATMLPILEAGNVL